MNKPSWDKAPEWAQWLAMDIDGSWFWYIDKPVKTPQGMWLNKTGMKKGVQAPKRIAEWANTLEQKPKG